MKAAIQERLHQLAFAEEEEGRAEKKAAEEEAAEENAEGEVEEGC